MKTAWFVPAMLVSMIVWYSGSAVADETIKAATDRQVRQHRMGTIVVETHPGAEVSIRQTRHEFHFGAAVSSGIFSDNADPETREKYLEIFKTHFNAAVYENALKWHVIEREAPGNPDYTIADRILAWCEDNRIPLRGHNIYWGVPGRVQDWLKELDDRQFRAALQRRGREVTNRYRGRIEEYDLNNEMVHGDYYVNRLGESITRNLFLWSKEGDPSAILYLNEYDVLTGNVLDEYMAQIRDFLGRGIPVGGIGVQGHLHSDTFDPALLTACLDSLAQFDLPVKITEFNMPGQRFDRDHEMTDEDERVKAENLVDYFRICFAHPAVDGILFWGFWEGALWLPNAALWTRDWEPLPAAEAYEDLVFGEWWTTWEGTADEAGRCEIPAFYGEYLVEAGGETRAATLQKRYGMTRVVVGK